MDEAKYKQAATTLIQLVAAVVTALVMAVVVNLMGIPSWIWVVYVLIEVKFFLVSPLWKKVTDTISTWVVKNLPK